MHSTVYALSRSNHKFTTEYVIFESMQDWADYVDDITNQLIYLEN